MTEHKFKRQCDADPCRMCDGPDLGSVAYNWGCDRVRDWSREQSCSSFQKGDNKIKLIDFFSPVNPHVRLLVGHNFLNREVTLPCSYSVSEHLMMYYVILRLALDSRPEWFIVMLRVYLKKKWCHEPFEARSVTSSQARSVTSSQARSVTSSQARSFT